MATLIAANYQSQSSSAYGFMSTSGITLKNNTLYTVKCRYKWTANGTASTCPYAFYLWRSTWANSCVITRVHSDYATYVGTWTSPSDATSHTWNINCYANANHNGGTPDGAILSVDWYELWEGDAREFSLKDAIALSENKSATDFLSIQNGCTNAGYFSTSEAKNAIRSWIGYYYKIGQKTTYGDWAYTYNHYTSASRSRSVYTYDVYSNGKKVLVNTVTQTEAATVTYANWSYNWVTTGNSTRSRTVTYSWSDYSSKATQTETGGARYIVLDSFSDDKSEGSVHEFSVAGGSITARTVSHDYWPSSTGEHIQTVVITGVTTTCTGFTCTTSGSTVTITAASKGTNESAANQATLTSTKSGWQTRSYGSCKQAENKITSVSLSASVSSGTLTAVSAAGGTVTWTPTVKYSSGSTSSDTSKFTPTYSVANYATVTGFATKGYSAATGNYNYKQIGGSYSVANGEKFLCTLGSASVTAGSPAGYAILAYDLSEGQNRGGVQLSNSKLADVITTNAADTLEFIMYAGINGATAGVAVTYNNLCISRMSTAGSGATQSGNKTTWATLGTTIGGRNAAVTVSVKSTYTTTAVTATAYTAQAYNAVTSVKAVVSNTSVSSVHFTYSGGTSISKTGGSIDVTPNGACKFTFTSGATAVQGTGGTYYGGTLSFARTYKKDTANTDWLTLNTSSGKITAANNTTSSVRKAQITGSLTVTWGSLTHTLAQSRTVKQNAGVRTYQIVLNPSSITWAASGGSQSVTVQYNTLWNGIKTAGPTALSGYTVGSLSNCTSSGTSGTTTISVGQNTSSSARNVSATFSKSGYSSATLTGTQNKPVTSTSTIYRVSSVAPSTLNVARTAGSGTLTVKMQKATITYYKDTSSGSAFTSSVGTWSALTGKEAYAANGNSKGTMFTPMVGDSNNTSNSIVSYGNLTNSLTNYTSTSEATWNIPYSYTTNSTTSQRTTKMRMYRGEYDLSGAGKNYCTLTQEAGLATIPIQVWGENNNGTDIYTSFHGGTVEVCWTDSTVGNNYTSWEWTTCNDIAFGGGVSQGGRREITNLDYPIPVSSVTHLTRISSVKVSFDYALIENTLNSSRYRYCDLCVEISNSGDLGDVYHSDHYRSYAQVISTNSNPLNGSSAGMSTKTFSFYNTVPTNSYTTIGLYFKFYD